MLKGFFCQTANRIRPINFKESNGRAAKDIAALLACLLMPLAYALPLAATAATKVAIIADTGAGNDFREVLALIKDEKADIVLIQGDLGYEPNTAQLWEQSINAVLGRNFPVLTVVGNHENFEWPLYQRYIKQRVDRVAGLSCRGEVGVKATCTFGNLKVVQVSPGIREVDGVAESDTYDDYVRSSFSNNEGRWRFCAWHKNQNAMQAFSKANDTGWGVYDACLDVGALVVTGHAHTYSRTYLMKDFSKQVVAHRNSTMTLRPGRSIAIVSGLGGREARYQENQGDWFAQIYTKTQGAKHGSLFCTLEPNTGECYFKAVNGSIPDRFSLRRNSSHYAIPATQPPSKTGVFRRTDRDEYRWIDKTSAGKWASTAISASCANDLGGERYSGNWFELISIAPIIDTIAKPCIASDASSPPPPSPEPSPVGSTGYVFSRTDTTEYRWIDKNRNGRIGSTWINKDCASLLGGATSSGDWTTLNKLAPALDSIKNPCLSFARHDGYVFSRTDTTEYRWIERNRSGQMGSTWISEECAQRLGGTPLRGDWKQLNRLAPGLDSIKNPCVVMDEALHALRNGYVFSRSDISEYRWIDRDENGRMGNIWISKQCADRLGGATVSGDWFDLITMSPGFDAIPSPCSILP